MSRQSKESIADVTFDLSELKDKVPDLKDEKKSLNNISNLY